MIQVSSNISQSRGIYNCLCDTFFSVLLTDPVNVIVSLLLSVLLKSYDIEQAKTMSNPRATCRLKVTFIWLMSLFYISQLTFRQAKHVTFLLFRKLTAKLLISLHSKLNFQSYSTNTGPPQAMVDRPHLFLIWPEGQRVALPMSGKEVNTKKFRNFFNKNQKLF